jgi:TRAP-type uncharacterized transport system substrate-binding protein
MLRHALISTRDLAVSVAPFVLLAAVLLWVAFLVLDPTPPRKVVLATGPEQGAYAEFGKRYAEELKRYGITVELRGTQGAAANLRLLRDPSSGVDLAFMQGGAGDALYAIDEAGQDAGLAALGNLFYEPVWVFYREDAIRRAAGKGRDTAPLTQLTQLKGLRVNIGAVGSGAANLVTKLLHANRVEQTDLTLTRLAPTPAVVALLAGELDALVFVSAPESPLVRMLLQTPGIGLLDFAQADAYARQFAFVDALKLPRGVVDLARDLPPQDVRLVAATSTMVAREGTHPALIQLFVQAARRIHGGTSWFSAVGQFPNAAVTEFPLAREAERFYRSGPPLLQRYLPYWLANLIDRMWVVLVSIIAVLIPLSRVVPPLYEFRIRSRIFRWYAQLRDIEVSAGAADAQPVRLLQRLDALDAKVEHIHVPLSYADELYALRSHIEMVRTRLRTATAAHAVT